ncbi:MAG: hypothetical protein K0R18_241 [Bacillales bacterium]|jgi:hypothetical protein|nr:hypothetical protein [Bacillales bacterium]
MSDDWKCLVCSGKIKAKCKCARRDIVCENGCEYHWSPFHKEYHLGGSDHNTDTMSVDCCNERKILNEQSQS